MKPREAVDWVQPEMWRSTPAAEKLRLLKVIQDRIETFADELTAADAAMKGFGQDEPDDAFQFATSQQTTVVPVASNVATAIELYEGLVKGEMPKPLSVENVVDGLYDVQVFPVDAKDRVLYSDRADYLRVKGEPVQVNPLEKEGGIIAVLGAGNYSSAFEVIRALFVDNCVVVHRAHHLNQASDAVWELVFKPLVDAHALAFCDTDGGRDLVKDERLKKIYFTGGTPAAKAIMESASAEFVSECGGNNPCIIVPGDRPWTAKEIEHQAIHIATFSKLNGGAVCGRAQTLVTSRNWPQRREFLDALEHALRDLTPGFTRFYPGSDKTFASFQEAYPDATLIQPEDGSVRDADFVLIEDAGEHSFATSHEAFCQVLSEVALDTEPTASDFLPKAVEFANEQLMGTLGACILIDEDSKSAHQDLVDQAVTDLCYGGIAVNTMPPYVWMNPYLTWGGNEEGEEFVSGRGNFGNLMSFENVEKSIVTSRFMSAGHLVVTNKASFVNFSQHSMDYAIRPSWRHLGSMTVAAFTGRLHHKDF